MQGRAGRPSCRSLSDLVANMFQMEPSGEERHRIAVGNSIHFFSPRQSFMLRRRRISSLSHLAWFHTFVRYYKATDSPSMNMTARQELSSWLTPSKVETRPVPDVNSKAPSLPQIQFPRGDGRPVIVTFLRHCGCPCMTISYPNSEVILMLCSRRENLLIHETDSFREQRCDMHCRVSQREGTHRQVARVGGWSRRCGSDCR